MLQPTAPADDPTTPDPNAGNSHTAAPDSMSLQSSQTVVHQSLVGAAPAYLSDDCRLLSDVGRRPLRSNSNDMRKLLVPRTHNKLGDRSFSAAGPRLWNDLPPGIRRPGLTFDSEALSDFTEFIGTIQINLSACLSVYLSIYLFEWNLDTVFRIYFTEKNLGGFGKINK